jgi:hypothetical protein
MLVSGTAASVRSFSPGLSWPLLIAAAAFLLLIGRPELLNDGDIYWHVATGQWILEHGAVPASDLFSHTRQGEPWAAHEWLAQVLFAAAYAWAGWTGVVIVAAAAFAAALALLSRFLLRHLEPVYMLLFVVMSAGLLAPHLLARPHTLVAPLLVLWCIGLVRAQEEDRTPRWWLAALMGAWANLHGSFVFGLALAGPFLLEAIVKAARRRAPWSRAMTWGAFLLLATLASLLTPLGVKGLLFATEVDQMRFALSQIGEWRSPDFQRLQPLELTLLLAGAAILYRGMRLPLLRLLVLLGLVHLALKHVRHADLLALVAPVILAQPFAAQWPGAAKGKTAGSMPDRLFHALAPRAAPVATVLVVLLLASLAFRAINADALRPSAMVTPAAALQAMRQNTVAGPVFNAYEFGGFLIHAGVPTFVDGRTDLYGERFLMQYFAAVNATAPEALPALLQKHGIQWTLLVPGMAAIAVLDRLPGWRRLHADSLSVVHVREHHKP